MTVESLTTLLAQVSPFHHFQEDIGRLMPLGGLQLVHEPVNTDLVGQGEGSLGESRSQPHRQVNLLRWSNLHLNQQGCFVQRRCQYPNGVEFLAVLGLDHGLRVATVVVEALFALLPHLSLLDPLLEGWWNRNALLLLSKHQQIDAHLVSELEGAHGEAHLEFHGRVDDLFGGLLLVKDPGGLVHVVEDYACCDESWDVLATKDGGLAQLPGEVLSEFDGLLSRVLPFDDLHELHDDRRVEEVHSDHLLGPLRGAPHLGDAEA